MILQTIKPLRLGIVFIAFLLLASHTPTTAQTTLAYTADDQAYRNGLELMDREKYSAAQKAFQEYIDLGKNDLKSVEAKYYIAISALNLSNADAEPMIERFIADYPNHPKALVAYYELGNFYFNRKKYDKSIDYFKKVNAQRLTSEQQIEVEFKLAYAHFSKQQFAEAGKLFNTLKRTQHKYTYAASYYAGYIEFRDSKYDEALIDLRKATNSEEYKPLVPYMIANIYYKQQRYDELIAYVEQVGKDKTIRSREDISLLAGEAYYRKGNYAKAAEYFEQYAAGTRTRPSTDVAYRLAFSQYKTGNYPKAIDNFKPVAAATKDTLSQYASYHLGLSYLKGENKPFAVTAFDAARKGKFSKEIAEDAAFYHAKVSYDAGNNSEAIVALKEFTKIYPGSKHISEVNELLGEAYLNSNNYAEAIAHMESIQRKTPRINRAYQRLTFNRGVELFNNERFDEAVDMFSRSLKTPEDADLKIAAYFWSGESYSAARKFPEAINQYAAVFRESRAAATEYHLKSRYGIGYAYYNTKDYPKALEHFREYVNRASSQPAYKQNYTDALLRLADSYYVTKNYNEAVRYYDQAIAQNTTDKDYALYQKGIVLTALNRPEDAKKAYDQVVSQHPKSRYAETASFQKADADFENGSYEAAIQGYSSLIQSQPNSPVLPYAYLRRALSYSNLKNYDKAIADYQVILNQYTAHKTSTDALLGLQEALANAGRGEEFSTYLAKYKKTNPQNDAVENIEFEAAKSLYFSEKYQKAIEGFNAYLSQYPSNVLSFDAKYYIAESYLRLNDLNNARQYYGQVLSERKSQFVPRAVSRMAELELTAKNYPQAVNFYLQSLANARNKRDQFTAWTGLMDAYYGQNKYDSVVYFADQIVNTGNATLSAQNKALLYRGKAAYAQENYDRAIDEFLKTLNSAQDENGAEAQYLMGEAQYKQKQYKQSLETLFQLNKSFAAYEKWRGKGFLLMADNYAALNEMFQAKATLNSIIENAPDQELVAAAKAKLKELESRPQQTATPDTSEILIEDEVEEEDTDEDQVNN
jgi:tetratricopeptide (TPR) repeat protein